MNKHKGKSVSAKATKRAGEVQAGLEGRVDNPGVQDAPAECEAWQSETSGSGEGEGSIPVDPSPTPEEAELSYAPVEDAPLPLRPKQGLTSALNNLTQIKEYLQSLAPNYGAQGDWAVDQRLAEIAGVVSNVRSDFAKERAA